MHFERLGLYLNPQKKAEQTSVTVPATGADNAKPTGDGNPAGDTKTEPKPTAVGGKPNAAVTKPAGNAKPAETVPATAAAGVAKPTGEAGIPGESDAKKKLPETGTTLS